MEKRFLEADLLQKCSTNQMCVFKHYSAGVAGPWVRLQHSKSKYFFITISLFTAHYNLVMKNMCVSHGYIVVLYNAYCILLLWD